MILITRPHEEAKVLEKELLKIGKECVTDSLISFKFHFKKIPFEKNVLYLISSSQSVKVLLKYKNKYRPLLKNGTFIVVGKKVATELTKIASVKIIKVTKDSSDMKKFLFSQKQMKKKYKKIVFISGTIFNREFVTDLRKKGINIKRKILYTTLHKKRFMQKTIRLFNQGQVSQVVLYSIFTAKIFLKLLKSDGLEKKVGEVIPISLSNRIDIILKKSSLFRRTYVSRSPNEKSIIRTINSQKY